MTRTSRAETMAHHMTHASRKFIGSMPHRYPSPAWANLRGCASSRSRRLTAMTDVSTTSSGLVSNWRHVLRTGNPPEGPLDPVSRWLVLTRAAVLPMTLTAGLIAGLLAVGDEGFRPGLLVLAVVGIVLAHMSNNLMNDLADANVGSDTDD